MLGRILLLASFLVGLAACGPGYRVIARSGGPPASNPLGVHFDYSQASFRGGLNEQAWVAQRTPDEIQVWQLVRNTWHQAFVNELTLRSGLQVVPATGNEPVVLVVAVQEIELGRFMPFAHVATQLHVNMRFMRGQQLTDEINVRCGQNPGMGSTRQGRMASCGQQHARATANFIAGR